MKAQVLCKTELSTDLLLALKNKLLQLHYNINPKKEYKKLKGKFSREFRKFQEDYNLPVGKWTIETMEFLYQDINWITQNFIKL